MEWIQLSQAGEFKASTTQTDDKTGLQVVLFTQKLFCSHIQITQALSRESFTTMHHHHNCIYSMSALSIGCSFIIDGNCIFLWKNNLFLQSHVQKCWTVFLNYFITFVYRKTIISFVLNAFIGKIIQYIKRASFYSNQSALIIQSE